MGAHRVTADYMLQWSLISVVRYTLSLRRALSCFGCRSSSHRRSLCSPFPKCTTTSDCIPVPFPSWWCTSARCIPQGHLVQCIPTSVVERRDLKPSISNILIRWASELNSSQLHPHSQRHTQSIGRIIEWGGEWWTPDPWIDRWRGQWSSSSNSSNKRCQ